MQRKRKLTTVLIAISVVLSSALVMANASTDQIISDAVRGISSLHNSTAGSYMIPIRCSSDLTDPNASQVDNAKLMLRNSKEKLWTKTIFTVKGKDAYTQSLVRQGKVGINQYVLLCNENKSISVTLIVVKWTPQKYDSLYREFTEYTVLWKNRPPIVWIPGSDQELTIGGKRAMSGQLRENPGEPTAHKTYFLVHAYGRSYQITFSAITDFDDQCHSLDKVKEMTFLP